ncbi:threonine/serine exporter family protein [Petroclostridium sp. X23]|uniref:threonine/serine exporter family protein n=1 Tax=Petroclostridium sp. X23 TaxID=3045146 RepID=UPI0024AD1197|nr:threonine/serine exporter family protein [Petroclostridium sp. X23]WHH59585.1 threonine/serine exporter family protein [Petroclostridium sp. X23]
MMLEAVYSYFATIFFAYIFNAPKKSVFITGMNGSIGWLIYSYLNYTYQAEVLGSFTGALVVGIISEYLARHFKMPATIFLTSGIIPLVPGTGLYYTMLYLVQKQYSSAMQVGVETIFIAGSIAAAVAISASLFKKRNK